jgi:DNA-binding transcriptional ArsR family regulator
LPTGRGPASETYRLADLEQLKVLADPLRIRILELLCEERTTKQVAGILGQPPTRLYHHVAALERVGLIRLARTRQRRGALEKYFVAVARSFSADPRLFSSGKTSQAREATQGIVVQILENTAADLRALLDSGECGETLREEAVLSYLEVRASPEKLNAIRASLVKLLKGCAGVEGKAERPGPGYRLTIAFFPLAGRRPPT